MNTMSVTLDTLYKTQKDVQEVCQKLLDVNDPHKHDLTAEAKRLLANAYADLRQAREMLNRVCDELRHPSPVIPTPHSRPEPTLIDRDTTEPERQTRG